MEQGMRLKFWIFALLATAVLAAGCQSTLGFLQTATETPSVAPTRVMPSPTANILFPYDASVLVFPEQEDRQVYQVVDLSQYNDFFQSLALSQIENFEWVSDPLEIALRLESWPPAEPDCKNKKIYFLPANTGSVILIIISEDCPDDSIAARKIRIEMHDDDGRWVVDWMGQMRKCRRGEIESRLTDWHIYLCP